MAFSPSSLFTGGIAGAWYDPSDLSTLFQDTAGTVPVTTAGQSVARINDKSGNGLNLTQATAANQPTYQVDGSGNPYLSFDGVNDRLTSSTAISGNTQSIGCACLPTNGGNQVWAVSVSSSDRSALRCSTTANSSLIAWHNGTSAIGKSVTGINTAQVLLATVDKVTPAVTLRMNAVDESGTTNLTPSATVGSALGSNTAASTNFFAGNFYGLVHVAKALSVSERANLEGWLGAKCGVSGLGPAVGTSAGSAAVSGVGKAKASGAGSSAGAAAVSGVGKATASAAGSSAGVASVSGVALARYSAIGSAAGAGSASGVGKAMLKAAGSSAGAAAASGVGKARCVAIGTASGSGFAAGVGHIWFGPLGKSVIVKRYNFSHGSWPPRSTFG